MYKRIINTGLDKRLWIVYILIFFYLYIIQLYAAWPFSIHDAFISLRYATHFFHHQSLVWNIGEPTVEAIRTVRYNQLRHKLGRWLSAHPNSSTFSSSDYGIISFIYGGEVIDSYCPNNKMMSSSSIHYRTDKFENCLLNKRQTHKTRFLPPVHAILQQSTFFRLYHPIKRFIASLNQKGLEYIVYERLHQT